MTPDLMERILKLKKCLSDGKEEQPSSDEIKKFNNSSKFLQNKRCMGETFLLIRKMSEKYGGSQGNEDPEKNENSEVLKKCSRTMRQLYTNLPWDNAGVEMDQHDQYTFQFVLSSVLVELEKMVKNPPKNPQQSVPNSDPTDELAVLMVRLKDEQTKREVEDMRYQLLLSQESVLTKNAISAQTKAEEMLAKEKSHSEDLENRLAHTKRKLESANEDKRKLKNAYKTLQKSYMALQRDQSSKTAPVSEKTQELSKKVVVQKDLESDTLSVLKQQLIYAQRVEVQEKTTVSEIKRDIANLCYNNAMMSSPIKKKAEKKTSFKSLKHTAQDTVRVVDRVLKAFQFHKQLKFPACEIKWQVVCRSLQNDLLAVRENWRHLDWNYLKNSSTKGASDLIIQSAMSSVTSKDSSRSAVSNFSSFSVFQGKIFGDRRLCALKWCQEKIRPYNVPMYEFSASWTSGRALCALIHAYRPQLIAPKYLRQTGPVETLEFGVNVAKGLGVRSPIDLIQECSREKPNYERVFEFVEELRRCLEALP